MKHIIENIRKTLPLSFSLAIVYFKLKNERTYLGIFWYLLNPILTFSLLFFIFNDRLGGDIPYYSLYLFLGIIIFNFFQTVTIESNYCIAGENKGIIKSINFDRKSLVIALVLRNLFSHIFEIIIFSILLLFFKISVFGIFYYLILLFFLSIFSLGVSFIFSALTVYFADFGNIWNFVSRLLWFVTPIFYAIEGQTELFYANLLNPLFYFISISRDIIIYSKIPQLWMVFAVIFYSFFFLFAGIFIFNKLKYKFAEKI